MRPYTVPLATLAALALMPDAGAQCNAALTRMSFPKRTVTHQIGYDAGPEYDEANLVAPRLVPVGVVANDSDTLRMLCGAQCFDSAIQGNSVIEWELNPDAAWPSDPSQYALHFVDGTGARSEKGSGPNVFVLMNLPEGATHHQCHFTALINDAVTAGADTESKVIFVADITKTGDTFEISVKMDDVMIEEEPNDACAASGVPACELVGGTGDKVDPPMFTQMVIPRSILLGETRPLLAGATDIDTQGVECGTTPGTMPVSSDFKTFNIDDHITYFWELNPNKPSDGAGTFLTAFTGESTFFLATQPGEVNARVRAVSSREGDESVFDFTIKVIDVKPKKVRFGEMLYGSDMGESDLHHIRSDYSGNTYVQASAPTSLHWQDTNSDGQASSANERNVPLIYPTGEKVGIQWIEFTRGGVAAMPGNWLLGETDQAHGARKHKFMAEMSRTAFTDDDPIPDDKDKAIARDLLGSNTLGNGVTKIDPYAIEWQLVSWDETETPIGVSRHRIYTIKEPIPAGDIRSTYLRESAIDIACRGVQADGAPGSAASAPVSRDTIIQEVLNEFEVTGSGDLTRIDRDSLNNAPQYPDFVYWPPNTGNLAMSWDTLLSDLQGLGECSSFADLYRKCLAIHDIDSTSVFVQPPSVIVGASEVTDILWLLINDWVNTDPVAPLHGLMAPTAMPLIAGGAPNSLRPLYDEGAGALRPGTPIPGQNNATPPNAFAGHCVVRVDGKIADPSYGSTLHPTEAAHEAAAFAGYRTPERHIVGVIFDRTYMGTVNGQPTLLETLWAIEVGPTATADYN